MSKAFIGRGFDPRTSAGLLARQHATAAPLCCSHILEGNVRYCLIITDGATFRYISVIGRELDIYCVGKPL